jgi:hypothetical protein
MLAAAAVIAAAQRTRSATDTAISSIAISSREVPGIADDP